MTVIRRRGKKAESRHPDPGIAAVQEIAKRYDDEPQHAEQVCRTSLALFDATAALHGLGHSARRLLHAAALLHDIGYSVDAGRHHKASRDLILEAQLKGFSEEEEIVLACIARYHRGGLPKESHKGYRDLSPTTRHLVDRLAAILRIADGLDRSHAASTQHLRVEQKDRGLLLHVTQRRRSAMDIDGGMRKRDLFERVFGVKLDIAGEAEARPASESPSKSKPS